MGEGGRAMRCLLCIRSMFYVLRLNMATLLCTQCAVTIDRAITSSDYISLSFFSKIISASHVPLLLQNIRCIEAETKWLPFSRRYFPMHLHDWKYSIFDDNFTEVFIRFQLTIFQLWWRKWLRTPLSEPIMVSLRTHICLNELIAGMCLLLFRFLINFLPVSLSCFYIISYYLEPCYDKAPLYKIPNITAYL